MPSQKVYDQIAAELSRRVLHEGLWTRAFAEANGDMTRARLRYLQLRGKEIAKERLRGWCFRHRGLLIILTALVVPILAVFTQKQSPSTQTVQPIARLTPSDTSRRRTAEDFLHKALTAPASDNPEDKKRAQEFVRKPLGTQRPIEFTPESSAALFASYVPAKNLMLYDRFPGKQGPGTLAVENGTSQHAIAKLIDTVSNMKLRSFFIRSNTTGGINLIPNGRYRLVFAFGEKVAQEKDRFVTASGFSAFQETLDYSTTDTGDGIQFAKYHVTLQPVANGNAKTQTISENEFEAY
jgi:hypothetical protein